jgi:hypothetical protein
MLLERSARVLWVVMFLVHNCTCFLCTSFLAPPLFRATLHGKIALRAPFVTFARSLELRAVGEPKDGDIFSEDFASYNNVDNASVFEGAPKFSTKKKDLAFVGFGSSFPLTEEDMTDELKERVYYVMLDALDNYPPEEVGRMLDLLWEAGTLYYNTTCIFVH